ncbi:MAG: HAD-IA family hydrolase [Pontixanthobacter sp.]
MTPRLAVFDCDGTLVDGQVSICEAMEAGFAAADLPPPDRHDIRRIVGLSLPQAVAILAPEARPHQVTKTVQGYKNHFRLSRTEGRLQEPLYDGIAGLLDTLRADGWRLAVATGKSDRGLVSCLATHGLSDHFVSLQTADRHPSKPDPAMLHAAMGEAGVAPDRTVMIGDTTFDMIMARGAYVAALGVDWGYHASAELMEEGARQVCSTPHDLSDALSAIVR